MNRRQKKKRFKQINGYNPPKNAMITNDFQLKELQGVEMQDLRKMAEAFGNAFSAAGAALEDLAERFERAFENIGKALINTFGVQDPEKKDDETATTRTIQGGEIR